MSQFLFLLTVNSQSDPENTFPEREYTLRVFAYSYDSYIVSI